jgi:SAM-dependent methyltransferase
MTTPMKSPPMPVARQYSTLLQPGAPVAERGEVRGYALGYGERELRRLMLQSRMLGDLTENLFKRAGLAPGMQVLDLGCGAGDVSLLAASFVGPSGRVVGVDQNAESVAFARHRAQLAGLDRVSFETASLQEYEPSQRFDAIVGRLILLYLPDPGALLRKLAAHLSDGGVMAFQEMDISTGRGVPPVPLYSQCGEWICRAFEGAGVPLNMGSGLPAVFRKAGLPDPELCSSVRVGDGPDTEIYEWIADTVRSLLPLLDRCEPGARDEIQIDTLEERLRRAALASGSVLHGPTCVGAWARRR